MSQSLHFITSSLYSAQKTLSGNCNSVHLQRSCTCSPEVKFNMCPSFICTQVSHSERFLSKFLLQVGLSWIPKSNPITCCISQSSRAQPPTAPTEPVSPGVSVQWVGRGCTWLLAARCPHWAGPTVCAHRASAEGMTERMDEGVTLICICRSGQWAPLRWVMNPAPSFSKQQAPL